MRFFDNESFEQILGDLFLDIVVAEFAKNHDQEIFEVERDWVWVSDVIQHRIYYFLVQFNVACLENALIKKRKKWSN